VLDLGWDSTPVHGGQSRRGWKQMFLELLKPLMKRRWMKLLLGCLVGEEVAA